MKLMQGLYLRVMVRWHYRVFCPWNMLLQKIPGQV
jgi:hypothetical protein